MYRNQNILSKINSIEVEDLYLLEKDLCYHEKVSVGFLLFADNKTNAEFILQKLMVISQTPNDASDILMSYSKVNKNWKPYLVEALAIIKANKILRKLGLNISEVRTYFLPHIPEMTLHMTPIVKALYNMCDMLTPTDAGKLVLDIRDYINTPAAKDHLRFYNFDYLEIFLLDWITKRVIDASGSDSTDVSILIDYLKFNEMKNIKDILSYTLKDINLETNDSQQEECIDCENLFSEENAHEKDKINLETHSSSDDKYLGKCYKINKESAGFILIINQNEFHRSANPDLEHLLPKIPLKKRSGTDIDKESLRKIFSSFGYKPIVRDNQNHIEVLSSIREIVKRSIMYDSLIVCILTHGMEGSVYACDSVPIKIDEIEKILTEESLVGKPKMLIIQACQGDSLQKAKVNDNLESDSPQNRVINYGDIVKAMSTVPGFASFRHTKSGSWFIQTLCEKINELGDKEHILDILTEVNDAIGHKRGFDNACMTPISSQTLRKKFRLPSRLN